MKDITLTRAQMCGHTELHLSRVNWSNHGKMLCPHMSGEMGRWKWGPMIATVSAEAEVVVTKTKTGCVYTSESSLGKLSCVSLPRTVQ